MKKVQWLGVAFAGMLFATVSSAQQREPTREELLKEIQRMGEQMKIVVQQREAQSNGVAINAAEVNVLKGELEKLTADNKALKDKCGDPCKEVAHPAK